MTIEMFQDGHHQRRRVRISTLMLLVVIAALLFERWHRERDILRTEATLRARLDQAEVLAQDAQMVARQALRKLELVRNLQAAEEGSADRPRDQTSGR